MTRHGRATPLIWKTVYKSELAKMRNDYEDEVIAKLHETLDDDVYVTLLADRGFGDQKLYEYLEGIGWGYVIRFRECITVRSAKGLSKPARDWLSPSGSRPEKSGQSPRRCAGRRSSRSAPRG